MRALKIIWDLAVWAIAISMLIWAISNLSSLPLSTPDEIKTGSMWIVGIGVPFAAYFLWELKKSSSTFSAYTISNYLRAVTFTHWAALWYFSAKFGWWEDGQGEFANAALLETFLNGVFFNFFGSFDLNFSNFQPESHLYVWRSITFIFGFAYTFILPAVIIVIYQALRKKPN